MRPANTAQDGHTHGEQAVFATLWRLAKRFGQGQVRALIIGERSLAAEVPMAYSNVQDNLRSLTEKLAIEIRPGAPNRPKTYIVFPYEEILERRRAAGLTHVIRRTGGVFLVNPAASSGAPNSGAAAPIAPDDLRALIEPHLETIDDSALQQLWRECRTRAEDCTPQEIAHFVGLKLRVSRNIQNPVGFVLQAVPKCFDNGGHTNNHQRAAPQATGARRSPMAGYLRVLA